MGSSNSENLFLVLSNIAAILPFSYALFIRQYPEATLLGIIAIISFFYHLCQGEFFCIVKQNCANSDDFAFLQFADEFFVFIGILWFIAYFFRFTGISHLRFTISFIFIAQAIVFIPLISDNEFFIYEVILIFIAFIVALAWTILKPSWLKSPSFNIAGIFSFIFAGLLLIVGFTLFVVGGDPGDPQYIILHGIWHILLFIAAFFILDIPFGNLNVLFLSVLCWEFQFLQSEKITRGPIEGKFKKTKFVFGQ